MSYLDNINSPQDLKKLDISKLDTLCTEIRTFLIENISKTGGHLSSNLGIVETTVALHYVFNSPKDKFIFDVSHQCYVHKILTNRKNLFNSLRKINGLSGFTNILESPHDTFTLGHSSTSIAMAAGIAIARDIKKEKNKVIALIGDGSLTGGLAYEGLNNVGILKTDLIVILNDNDMSISKSVGSLTKHLNKLRIKNKYFNFKNNTENFLNKVPVIGKYILKSLKKLKRYTKYYFVNRSAIFEELGFKYIGPIDGHNIKELINTFNYVKTLNEPLIIHIKTIKGKGYRYSELNPTIYHGVGKFDVSNGIATTPIPKTNYSKTAGDTLEKLANKNENIVVVTAAMTDGTGIKNFTKKFPNRFFDVGIAEEYAVSFCAGLSKNGLNPVFLVYSTFLQRAYDQILHDICLNNLFTMFLIDRAGIVGQDGKTHQGIYDIAMLSNIPNLMLLAPRDNIELEEMIKFGFSQNLPIAIRYPKGNSYISSFKEHKKITKGVCEILNSGKDIAIFGLGSFFKTAEKVYYNLKEKGYNPTLINPRFIFPMDENILLKIAKTHKYLITLEDGILSGGYSEKVASILIKNNLNTNLLCFGYPKTFIEHGEVNEIIKLYNLDDISITNDIIDKIKGI